MKKTILLSLACLAFISLQAQTTAKEWYDKGLALKTEKKYTDAITAFKKAAGLQAGYAEALYQLGWCYNEEKQYNEALSAFTKEISAGAKDKASTHFEMGFAYYGLKKYDESVASYNKTTGLDAGYALAYKERGNAFYRKKEYAKALEDFTKYTTLEDDITDADFYYRKGWCENDQEKYSDAVQSLKNCTALDENDKDAFSELGYAYYKLARNDDAITSYRVAMLLDAQDFHPVVGTADVYYENLKNYDSAIVWYEKGKLLTKPGKISCYRLGWCYNDKSRYADAVEPLKQAVALDPAYDAARTELGYAYYKLEKYDDALSQFLPVMKSEPKDELSRYYAGFCYYLKNDQTSLKKMIAELKALNSTEYVETLNKYIK